MNRLNTLNKTLIALALAFAFNAGAIGQTMSENDYKTSKENIKAEFTAAKGACGSLSGNPNDICIAGAERKEKIAMSELEAMYKPSPENRYQVLIVAADVNYAMALEQCDAKAGNVKDVCVKEADAVKVAATSDADVQMKIYNANEKANEKSDDAIEDAIEDSNDAQYSVAKEKCDAFAGDAKEGCLEKAKHTFGE